jgi:hypothetical protein
MPEHDNAARAPTMQTRRNERRQFIAAWRLARRHGRTSAALAVAQRRAAIYSDDAGWLAYAATQGVRSGETPIALRVID